MLVCKLAFVVSRCLPHFSFLTMDASAVKPMQRLDSVAVHKKNLDKKKKEKQEQNAPAVKSDPAPVKSKGKSPNEDAPSQKKISATPAEKLAADEKIEKKEKKSKKETHQTNDSNVNDTKQAGNIFQ